MRIFVFVLLLSIGMTKLHEVNNNWKPVVGYEERLEVSIEGNVNYYDKNSGKWVPKSIRNGKSVKNEPENAYKFISFKVNGNSVRKFVHRLVAEAFVKGYCQSGRNNVDHKDENRSNNCKSNLQWVTREENNCLGQKRKKLREYIIKADNSLGYEEIMDSIKDEFKDSKIFSFEKQFEIAYNKVALQKNNR